MQIDSTGKKKTERTKTGLTSSPYTVHPMDIRCNTRTTSPYLFQHGPDQRDGLQCFAQTHFVRQDATAMFPMGGETRDAVVDEAHAFDLVWP